VTHNMHAGYICGLTVAWSTLDPPVFHFYCCASATNIRRRLSLQTTPKIVLVRRCTVIVLPDQCTKRPYH